MRFVLIYEKVSDTISIADNVRIVLQ